MFISNCGLFNDVFSTLEYTATNDGVINGKRIEMGAKRSCGLIWGNIHTQSAWRLRKKHEKHRENGPSPAKKRLHVCLTRSHLSQLAEPPITQARCTCIAKPSYSRPCCG